MLIGGPVIKIKFEIFCEKFKKFQKYTKKITKTVKSVVGWMARRGEICGEKKE